MGNLIRSERLALRQLETEEARALLQGEADSERPWMTGYPMQGTLIAVEAFVRAVDNGADPGAWGVYQLVRSGDDMVVGDIGFHGPPNPGGSVTVGYGLAPEAGGRATRPRRCGRWSLGRWSSRRWRRSRRITTHANLPSQRVMERAGVATATTAASSCASPAGSPSGGRRAWFHATPPQRRRRSARHAHVLVGPPGAGKGPRRTGSWTGSGRSHRHRRHPALQRRPGHRAGAGRPAATWTR